MGLHTEMAEKHADRLGSHTAFEAEYKQCGHDQADEPGAAGLRFPKPRLRIAISAIPGLEVTMHAAFGKPGSLRQAPDALLPVFINRVSRLRVLCRKKPPQIDE